MRSRSQAVRRLRRTGSRLVRKDAGGPHDGGVRADERLTGSWRSAGFGSQRGPCFSVLLVGPMLHMCRVTCVPSVRCARDGEVPPQVMDSQLDLPPRVVTSCGSVWVGSVMSCVR